MLRTISTVERTMADSMLPPITVADSVATDVLQDTTDVYGEIAYIELFNAGANKAYFAYGRDCDNLNNYNGWILAGQAMSVNTRQRVSVFSVGGTVIARTVMKRSDIDFSAT